MQLLPWVAVVAVAAVARCDAAAVDPYALPEGLLIGAGVSAIQTEGGWDADGKGESAADHVLHTGKLVPWGFSNDSHQHDVAADSYQRYREDVKGAADLGLQLYRFSISWARILPNAVDKNQKGIDYYHNLINEIISHNMTPMATLYHFDHPWTLEEQFKGWQSEKMVNYFKTYAQLAFQEYGGKVKLWTTLNEPNMYCTYFPNLFLHAGLYTEDDIDHYACLRNTILAHAEAYHAFKEGGYDGKVGFTALLMTARPNSTLPEDAYAADAFNQMSAGVVLHPVVYGDYPELVKQLSGSKVQPFTEAEKTRVNGTSDFIGFNVYYSMVASYTTNPLPFFANVPIIGPFLQDVPFANIMVAGVDFQHFQNMFSLVEPDAIRSALVWTWNQYKLPIIVTENGFGDMAGLGKEDYTRGVYHSAFLRTLLTTMQEYSIDVLGYCTWSLIDSFEWSAGFKRPFGLIHVDYENGTLNRSMKNSSSFWTELARTRSVPVWEAVPDADTPSSATTASAGFLLLVLALALPALSH